MMAVIASIPILFVIISMMFFDLSAKIALPLGFPPLCAVIVCLIYNSVPVCFGGAGTPTNTAIATLSQSITDLGGFDVRDFW